MRGALAIPSSAARLDASLSAAAIEDVTISDGEERPVLIEIS